MTRYTYIIPKGVLTATLQKIDESEIAGLVGMFSTPLSKSGSLPATHYISSGILSDEQVQFLDDNIPPAFTKDVGRDPFEVLAEQNLQLIQSEVIGEA